MKQRIGTFTRLAVAAVGALALASVSLSGGTAEAAKPYVEVTDIGLNPSTTTIASTETVECQLVLNIQWDGNALDKKKGIASVFVTSQDGPTAVGYDEQFIGGRTDTAHQFISDLGPNSTGTYHVEVVISSTKGPGGQDPGRTLAFKSDYVYLSCG